MAQKNYKPHYEHLKNKWTEKHRELQKELLGKHGEAIHWVNRNVRNFALGSIGSLILLAQQPSSPVNAANVEKSVFAKDLSSGNFLVHDLSTLLPEDVRPLTLDEENAISELLSSRFKTGILAELNGKRLNRTYGFIGAEQHLARYPGDNMGSHFVSIDDSKKYFSSGMAPGLGAWRYFADSKNLMTQKDIDREKYYIAVQTFLAPGFNNNVKEYVDFFKFRKMIVVNPQNGKAIVTVIGDAGPAEWTGKSLGGSPEVMSYLQRVDGKAMGAVLYFFIDDPEDKVPLGPIEMKS